MIKKPHDKHSTKPSPHGHDLENVYSEVLEKGEKVLVVTGQTSIYDKIQASLEPTKISNIIRRYQAGDIDALNKIKGVYLDITGMPTDLLSANAALNSIKDEFNSLSAEIKEKYGSDVYQFLQDFKDGKVAELNQLNDSKEGDANESNT